MQVKQLNMEHNSIGHGFHPSLGLIIGFIVGVIKSIAEITDSVTNGISEQTLLTPKNITESVIITIICSLIGFIANKVWLWIYNALKYQRNKWKGRFLTIEKTKLGTNQTTMKRLFQKIKDRWVAEETALGKFIKNYIGKLLLLLSAIGALNEYIVQLPSDWIPQWIKITILICGSIAFIYGKTTVKKSTDSNNTNTPDGAK